MQHGVEHTRTHAHTEKQRREGESKKPKEQNEKFGILAIEILE